MSLSDCCCPPAPESADEVIAETPRSRPLTPVGGSPRAMASPRNTPPGSPSGLPPARTGTPPPGHTSPAPELELQPGQEREEGQTPGELEVATTSPHKTPRATPPPLPEAEDELDPNGGYLTYSTVNSGTVSLKWSKTKVKGAMCFGPIAPDGIVKPFKYKEVQEIKRHTTQKKEVFYASICDFFKEMRKAKCRFQLLEEGDTEEHPLKIVVLYDNGAVRTLEAGHVPIPLQAVAAVAALHRSAIVFDKTDTSTVPVFTQMARTVQACCVYVFV